MRERIKTQIDTYSQFSDHPFSKQIEKISTVLDSCPKILQNVESDLGISPDPRGAKGMSAEAVLRAAILMRAESWSYRELSFHISDSQTTKAFLRLGHLESYSHSTLQSNIVKISALVVPTAVLTIAANYVAVVGGIQALSMVPVTLHWLVILLGFIMLIPLNATVIGLSLTIGISLYALFGGSL